MPNTVIPLDTTKNGKRFFLGLSIMVIGYVVALTGGLASFRIPIAQSSGMLLLGLLASTLLSGWIAPWPAVKRYSRAFFPAYVIGTFMIASILALFADSDWKTWYLHPTAFQGTWIVLVSAFFHIGGIVKSLGVKNHTLEISVSEYNKDQAKNPYAPPMRYQLQTNNPNLDRVPDCSVAPPTPPGMSL